MFALLPCCQWNRCASVTRHLHTADGKLGRRPLLGSPGTGQGTGARADGFAGRGDRGDATVIEGEFEVVDRDDAEEEADGKSPPASRLGPRRSDDGTGRNSGG